MGRKRAEIELRRGHPFRPADEAGFTVIELIMTSLILVIISAPITGVLLAAAAESSAARQQTAVDQLLASRIEAVRTIPYTQVGIAGGNPSGIIAAAANATLPSGTPVTVQTKVTFVNDPIPTAYVTNADYKKVVVTITRTSDGTQLASGTTFVASASAPPLAGTGWVQIKRQVVDAVTTAPLPGTTVTVTGGPSSANRSDTTDAAGTVLFPALDSAASGTPVYSIAAALTGYAVFPDDLPPQAPEQVSSAPGLSSTAVIRMYKGASLTINVLGNGGNPFSGGVTYWVQSSRCGVSAGTIPAGQSSATVTTCQWATGKSVPLVPNVQGQVPGFDTYAVTAWHTGSSQWGATAPFPVPSSYPGSLSQTVSVQLGGPYPQTKQVTVKVTKGGKTDSNARVQLSGGPAGVSLYGTTDAGGNATFTIPVTSTAATFTVAANDMGAASGTATFAASSSTSSPIAATVAIS